MTKRGVDLADAVAAFEDDLALIRPDSGSRGESRFVTMGIEDFGRLLVVAHTEREARIRIVSGRLAAKQERKSYEG